MHEVAKSREQRGDIQDGILAILLCGGIVNVKSLNRNI